MSVRLDTYCNPAATLLRVALISVTVTAIFASPVLAREISDAQEHEQIRTAALNYLQARLQEERHEDVQIEIGNLDSRLQLSRCDAELEPFMSAHSQLVGNTQVGIRCASPKPWTLYITAKIGVYKQVVSAKRPLLRGATLEPQDMELVREDISSLHRGYLLKTAQAVGKVLRQNLSPGSVITLSQLKTPLAIRRGQKVTLLAETGGIQVRMSGTAMQDAATGDLIRVKNLTSKRIIEGTVLKNGTILVSL